jgi:hypothetical protein
MRSDVRWIVAVGVLVVLVIMGGCGPASPPRPARSVADADHDHDHDHGHDHDDDHGHDDHHAKAETLEAGVAELGRVVAAVKDALSDDDLAEADGHVHMVGHLIDDLHGLVARAKLPSDAEVAAKKALDELFECFDQLDTKLHSPDEEVRKAIDYAEHEPRVKAALEALDAIATGKPPAAANDIDE